ncbi:MAG: FeoB-associated Cys-rich membrane protein [Firmicutes bacterium]|nr:FeoB-associated Cys-rich membrane protein [Bacillota bacterium]
MNLATVIATIALVLVVFLAVRYIYKEKKKGSKCVGCPYAQGCQKYHGDGVSSCSDPEKMIAEITEKIKASNQ